MSHEAAQATTGDGHGWSPRRRWDVRPQPPSFTASVDRRHGIIRARGHVDAVAADLLAGSVLALSREGCRCIAVRIRPVATVDAPALELLADLARRLLEDDVRLVVE